LREFKDEGISQEAIREELSRILRSPIFVQSDRLGRFLRFTIEETLSGKAESLKEYVIGTEVYDRKADYQTRDDSIVRTEARRLRTKLNEYYGCEGKNDPIFIYYRTGSYAPVFRVRNGTNAYSLIEEITPVDFFIDGPGISIAVLPFRDCSASSLSATCAQGITDELTHEFMRTEGVRVTSASSVAQLSAQAFDVPALAQKLGVQIVFEGTVREENSRIRVTARVVNSNGFQIWSQRFETEPDSEGLFRVTEQIASALISRTRPEVSSIRNAKQSAGPSVLALYPAVLGAEAMLDEGSMDETCKALARIQDLVKSAPDYARLHAGIAQCYYEMALHGAADSSTLVAQAQASAARAVELDSQMIAGHASMGCALGMSWDWLGAEKSFQQALGLGAHAGAWRQYAVFLSAQGRFDEAWRHIKKAQEIDPFSHLQKNACAKFFHLSRRHEEGIEHFSKRLVYGPISVEAQLYLAFMLTAAGRRDDARRMAQNTMREAGAQPTTISSIAEILALSGEGDQAARLAKDFKLLLPNPPVSLCRQARLSLAMGDAEKAMRSLTSACKVQEAELVWLASDPRFDQLRENKQFIRMCGKVFSTSYQAQTIPAYS
jgi:TolB-like protein/tetratricopeptide (TPR) repeat protein